MQPGQLDDLAEALARASSLTDDLRRASSAADPADRPGFLAAQDGNDPEPLIERLARAERLTLVVGAGVSMEAGLPSWGSLVRAVLASFAPASLDDADRAAWLDAAGESGLLGMAATARALAGSDHRFVERVGSHLYRTKEPEQFDPGPLAREIALWKRAHPEVQLATFNYDRLLERALEDAGLTVESREDHEPAPEGVAVVRHLHGLLTGTPEQDALILTEGDYARWPSGSWQDAFMREALGGGVCVFLGLSFTDQNLLRWLYGSDGTEHVAVLTRQSAPRLSATVRGALEAATRERLRIANVTTYWADFYSELAQVLHEARRRRAPGKPPAAYPVRAQRRVLRGRRRCLPPVGLDRRQHEVREILSSSVAGVRAALEDAGVDPRDTVLGLGLWGLDYEQRDVTLWAASDRVHVDPSTVTGVPLAWGSEWVAVEAITQGSVVEWDPDVYASRWRSVRGIPLVWRTPEHRERILVGAATLTTTEPSRVSVFVRAEERAPGIRKTIDLALHDQLVRLWD